jgi:hypothetical protein
MYKINKNHDTEKFQVIEVESSNVINEFDTHAQAYELYYKLKTDVHIGFEGWTPAFMTVSVADKTGAEY